MRSTIPFLTLIAACAMGPKMRQVSLGLPEPRVTELLGPPDGRVREGRYEALKWANRLVDGWSNARADYWVILEDGKVIAYGPGDVRQSQGLIVLVPLPL